MKNLLLLGLLLLTCIGCEDVVDIDLSTETPKFVIDARGIQQENQDTLYLLVRLSQTAGFYKNQVPKISDAEVSVQIENQDIDIPQVSEGTYATVMPILYNTDYTLHVSWKDQEYEGTTQLYKTVPFDYTEQSNNTIDPDLTSINAYFTDPENEDNFYFFTFISKYGKSNDFTDDALINGSQVSTFYADEFDPGDEIQVNIMGIGERYYNYISVLLPQTQDNAGNPFSTAPSTVRGNLKNLTQPEDFPLGYFRLSQEFQITYVVE